MGRESDNEKKFNDYLDRILAGEEIKADPSIDKELRDALDFACKMADLRQSPPAQFQARLKADLLQKLEVRQSQKQAARGSFWDVFRGHPAWQGAVAVLLIIIVLAVVWRAGVFQMPSEKATATAPDVTTSQPIVKTPSPVTSPPQTTSAGSLGEVKGLGGTLVSIDANPDKLTYKSGEMVQIELSMRNITTGQLTVSDFPPIMSIVDENTKQPVYTFTAGKAAYTLEPNGIARYTYTWQQVDFNGQPVTGKYYVELEDLEYNGVPMQLNLNKPVNFEIVLK